MLKVGFNIGITPVISRAHKIKLKPNKAQLTQLSKTAGTARYAYNWGLAKWEELYKAGERCDAYMLSRMWTQERPEWSREVFNGSARRSLFNLGGAYKAFFQGLRKHPTFHKKGRRDSFYIDNTHARLYGSKIHLPNIGRVRMTERLRYEDAYVTSYNVKREADGWYVTISVEIDEERRTDSESFVGVDVGCHALAVASDGIRCEKPGRLRDLERQLKRRQRLLARKAKGSKNRAKARSRVARTYQRIRNIKNDAIHKFTATVAKNHGTVCIETLDVSSMRESSNKLVRKGVQLSAMAEVLRQLKYKCNNFIEVDSHYPSSKTCSNCGDVKDELRLGERTYRCRSCGMSLDRDLNASINLRNEGMRIYTVGHTGCACGENL